MKRLAHGYRKLEAAVQESAFAWGVLMLLIGLALWLALAAWQGGVTMAAGDLPEVKLARGLARLDAHHPGWADELDLATLEMWSMERCVLGQLCGHYALGWRALGLSMAAGLTDYGFGLPTEYWLPEILARRSAP